jgi:hypothetical protein
MYSRHRDCAIAEVEAISATDIIFPKLYIYIQAGSLVFVHRRESTSQTKHKEKLLAIRRAMAGAKTIWVRHETKAKEQRVTVTPDGCKALLEAGFRVVVERSSTRVIPDDEYGAVAGVEMAEANAWRALSHDDNLLIVGLKVRRALELTSALLLAPSTVNEALSSTGVSDNQAYLQC